MHVIDVWITWVPIIGFQLQKGKIGYLYVILRQIHDIIGARRTKHDQAFCYRMIIMIIVIVIIIFDI